MTKSNDVREALQREAMRVKSALSDFAALAVPRKKKPATEAVIAPVIAPPVIEDAPAPPRPKPIHMEPAESLGGWFDDMDDSPSVNFSAEPDNAQQFFASDSGWQGQSNPSVVSEPDFSPGVGEDFSDGFGSEMDIPGKTGQDTLSVPAIAANQNTPADGMPQPSEAINDVLDGFDW